MSRESLRWYLVGPGAFTWVARSIVRTLRRFWATTDPTVKP